MIIQTPGSRVVPKSVVSLRNLSTSDSPSSSNVFVTQSKAAPFDKPSCKNEILELGCLMDNNCESYVSFFFVLPIFIKLHSVKTGPRKKRSY